MLSRRFLRIKVLKSLYSFISSDEQGLIHAQKKMLFSITKSYELYHMLLRLPVELADYAREAETLRSKRQLATEAERNPNFRFANNPLITKIREYEPLNDYLAKNKLSWSKDNKLFKQLYQKLTEAEYYQEYIAKDRVNWYDERKVVLDFFRNEIEDNELLYDMLEEMSIFWIDEIEYFTSRVASQLSKMRSGDSLELLPIYNDESDTEFIKDLFTQSIIQYDDNVGIIGEYAKNWDVERITVMDRLLIIMAIVELEKIENIPSTVTLDEYIELAKCFSTNNSNIFINGILHKYISEKGITK